MPRRREEFTYRGYKIDELKAMGISELLPLMPARARRKIVRGFSRGEEVLLTKVREGDEKIRTHLREMIVIPEMVGKSIEIYNGKEFMKVEFQPESVFHYLGEFALTRRKVAHGSAGIGATRGSKYSSAEVMDMARIDYSQKISGDNIAKAKANELNMSPKHSIEIATFIRHQRVNDAIAYLNDVVSLKKAIPFRRFNRNVAHKRGLPGNWDTGRYPVKASKAYIRVLESVKKNAEYIGLDSDNLEIIHVSANRGRAQKSFFPRAMGRATPKVRESVNLEVVVREVV